MREWFLMKSERALDCVELKRIAQQTILEEARQLSREQQVSYLNHAAAGFWNEIDRLREERKPEVA